MAIITLIFCSYYSVSVGIYVAMSVCIACLIISVITYIKEESWIYLIITGVLVIGLSIALPLLLKNIFILGIKINIPISISSAIIIAYIFQKICFVLIQTISVIGDFFEYIIDYHRN